MPPMLTVLGPRGDELKEVIGTNIVPVVNPIVQMIETPSGRRAVYYLDIDAISAQQLAALTDHLARRGGLSLTKTVAMLLDRGLPILAEDTVLDIETVVRV